MKLTFALIIVTFSYVNAIVIDCDFKFVRNALRKNFENYQCYVNLITFERSDNAKISSIVGAQHAQGKADSDVKMFHSDKNTFVSFPRNIGEFFENIEVIDIYEGELKVIRKLDLEQFGDKLKILWLSRNELRNIDHDLFHSTPNVEWINFSENNILQVDNAVFANLPKLSKLYFKLNPCYSDSANDDPPRLKQLLEKIQTECKSIEYLRHQSQAVRARYQKIFFENHEIKSNATALLSIINDSDKEIEECKIEKNQIERDNERKLSKLKVRVAECSEQGNDKSEIILAVREMINELREEMKATCGKN